MYITFDQLPNAVSKIYEKLEAIENLLSNSENQPNQDLELLTVKQAAQFLSLSVPTIYGLIHQGKIPYMKRSKRCYFSKAELLEYIKNGRQKTSEEQAADITSEVDSILSNRGKKRN
jgi:excisionase family DNA binding protein